MTYTTDEEDDMEAVKEINEMIGAIQEVIEDKLVDRVVSAFAYILAENCQSDDHSAELASDMTMKIICGYVQMRNARKFN